MEHAHPLSNHLPVLLQLLHVPLIFIANCGPPSSPPSGYIFLYTSTIDGATVTFACQKSELNLEVNFTATVCNKQGKWDPDPAEFCAIALGKNQLSKL